MFCTKIRNLPTDFLSFIILDRRKILQQHLSDGLGDTGSINWQLTTSLAVAWVLVYFIVIKGVKSSGKVNTSSNRVRYVITGWLHVIERKKKLKNTSAVVQNAT